MNIQIYKTESVENTLLVDRMSDIETLATEADELGKCVWELFIAARSGAVNSLANVGLKELLLFGFEGD